MTDMSKAERPMVRRLQVRTIWLVAVTGVALPILAWLLPGQVRLQILFLFSGSVLVTLFFRSGNLMEWLGLSAVGSFVLFCLWTGLLWRAGFPDPRFLAGAILATNIVLVLVLRTRRPRLALRFGRFDLLVILIWIILRSLQWAVFARNGLHPDAGGDPTFVTRSWFGRDTLFLYGLVEQAMRTGSWPQWNPFFGGFGIAYPTLVPVGLAGLLSLCGERIATAAPGLLGAGLLSIVAAGLGLIKSAVRAVRGDILWSLGGALLLYALALRVDLIVYPHTQYFVLGVFLVFTRVAIIGAASPPRWWNGWFVLGWALTLFLLAAHQVTGTAALVLWGTLGVVASTEHLSWRRRTLWLISFVVLLLVVFLGERDINLQGPRLRLQGESLWGLMVGLKGWLPAGILVVWAGWVLKGTRRYAWGVAPLLAMTLGLLYWSAMQRDPDSAFVLSFNAERYLYHAFLAAFPLAAVLLSRLWWRCWHRPALRIGIVILIVLPFFQLPALSYKSRNLIATEPQVVSPDMLKAYEWIARNSDPDAVILRAPVFHPSGYVFFDRTLPAFTGRSLFVADASNVWGRSNIPTYEHQGRARFTLNTFAGAYEAGALAQACRARGIDLILFDESELTPEVAQLFESQWFRSLCRHGNARVMQPLGQGED